MHKSSNNLNILNSRFYMKGGAIIDDIRAATGVPSMDTLQNIDPLIFSSADYLLFPTDRLQALLNKDTKSNDQNENINIANTLINKTSLKRACCMSKRNNNDIEVTVKIPISNDSNINYIANRKIIDDKIKYFDKKIKVPKKICKEMLIDVTDNTDGETGSTVNLKKWDNQGSYCNSFYSLYCENQLEEFRTKFPDRKFEYDLFVEFAPDCACYGPMDEIRAQVKGMGATPNCYFSSCGKDKVQHYLHPDAKATWANALPSPIPCSVNICQQKVNLNVTDSTVGKINFDPKLQQECGFNSIKTQEVNNKSNPTTTANNTTDNTVDKPTIDDKATADKATADKATADKATADKTTADKATADKATADKTAADNTAADNTAVDKTAVDNTAVDKTAADKTADKATADKATADKIAADKTAADKATADKTAADKATADKVAADKVAADKVIADDKVAADKVIADDKAAANKTATDKVIADDKAAANKTTINDKATDINTQNDTNTTSLKSVWTELSPTTQYIVLGSVVILIICIIVVILYFIFRKSSSEYKSLEYESQFKQP